MINEKAVDHIEQYGPCHETGEQKRKILDGIGFPVGQKADYVIIAGCLLLRLDDHRTTGRHVQKRGGYRPLQRDIPQINSQEL
jgi:hypothetical protein